MTTRRELIKMGALLTAGGAMRSPAADSKTKTLLILGGTGFIGPHLTQEAQRRGWRVTHFNRGKTAAEGVEGVESLVGDRHGQLDALRGRKWDAVIDDTGFIPKYVKMSAELLAPNVGYCLFISSISVYASFAKPNDEQSPTGAPRKYRYRGGYRCNIRSDEGVVRAILPHGIPGPGRYCQAGLYRRAVGSVGPIHLLAGARLEGRRDAGAWYAA
jgi:hypothetical protein